MEEADWMLCLKCRKYFFWGWVLVFFLCLSRYCELKVFRRRRSKISWSSVSNAAERSNRVRIVDFPWSITCKRSLTIRRRAVSVLWCCLYADWKHACSPFLAMWLDNCSNTTLSKMFDTKDKLETDGNFSGCQGQDRYSLTMVLRLLAWKTEGLSQFHRGVNNVRHVWCNFVQA